MGVANLSATSWWDSQEVTSAEYPRSSRGRDLAAFREIDVGPINVCQFDGRGRGRQLGLDSRDGLLQASLRRPLQPRLVLTDGPNRSPKLMLGCGRYDLQGFDLLGHSFQKGHLFVRMLRCRDGGRH